MILTRNLNIETDTDLLIKQKISKGELSTLLMIVPTNRKSRSLKKEFISAAGGKVSGKINIETIGTFSYKIHRNLNVKPLKLLSEASAAVLLKRAFNNSDLKYFNRYKTDIPPGTLSRIQNIISEYKRHGVTPSRIMNEAELLEGSEKLKAWDISLIYSAYKDECRKTGSGETGDIYADVNSSAAGYFNEAFRKLYPEVSLVILNGFDEFSVPETDLIVKISDVPGSELLMTFDYDNENPGLFRHLKECYDRFTSHGFHFAGRTKDEEENPFREVLRKKYFNSDPGSPSPDFNIIELAALDRGKEVELIAKEIKDLILLKGAEPDRICVVFNLIQNYSPVIRDKFKAFGIPYNLTDRIPLSSSGPVTAVITLIEIIENDFYYKSIFRALSSGFISIQNVYLPDLIKVSARLKIISGYENWIEILDNNLRNCEEKDRILFTRASDSIKNLGKILSPMSGRKTIPAFRRSLLDFIDKLNMPGTILKFEGESEFFIRALASFYEIITELFTLLADEYSSEREFPLSFYLDAIRTAVQNSRFNITEKPGYGVQVTNLNEIRGLSFDYVFIGGMIDTELPTRYTPEIFFSGSYTREEWKHQVEERYHFYQSLCAWEKGLYLCRPLLEGEKEVVSSSFLSELKTLFALKTKNESTYTGTIYSIEDLREYAGKNFNGKEYPGINAAVLKRKTGLSSIRKDRAIESEYSGFITAALDDDRKENLKKNAEREYSASQLEVYALCPFRFFLERVIRLNVTEEPVEEMESLEFGSMLHRILFLFYTRISREGIILQNCSEQDFCKAADIIFVTAEEVISAYGTLSPLNFLEAEKLTGINGDRKKSVLYKFLLEEREESEGFLPYDFEGAFGKIEGEDGRVTLLEELKSGDIRLRGKIDRIDINKEKKFLRVTDYKLSGTKPSADDLHKGIKLQLPVYLYAAAEIIKKQLGEEYLPAGADIYSLKYQKKDFGRRPLFPSLKKDEDKLNSYGEIIKICRSAIDEYVKGISGGKFNLTTLEDREKKVCGFCNFRFVCRIDED